MNLLSKITSTLNAVYFLLILLLLANARGLLVVLFAPVGLLLLLLPILLGLFFSLKKGKGNNWNWSTLTRGNQMLILLPFVNLLAVLFLVGTS